LRLAVATCKVASTRFDAHLIAGITGGKTMNKPMTYKGYTAKIEYSDKDECLTGRISDIRRIITFQGDSVKEIRQAFEEAVDCYLHSCAEKNEEPEDPNTGRQVVRVSSALHSLIALAAKNENKSVGEWITEACKKPGDTED
jgi:predicted HicB family RNase H-like nuclease